MTDSQLPAWARAFPEWVGNVILMIAPNRVRRLWPMPAGIGSNFAQYGFVNDKPAKQAETIALMDEIPGYEKHGLELGLDWQPYLIWAKIGFDPFPSAEEPRAQQAEPPEGDAINGGSPHADEAATPPEAADHDMAAEGTPR